MTILRALTWGLLLAAIVLLTAGIITTSAHIQQYQTTLESK